LANGVEYFFVRVVYQVEKGRYFFVRFHGGGYITHNIFIDRQIK
jgi:hypothetical protein